MEVSFSFLVVAVQYRLYLQCYILSISVSRGGCLANLAQHEALNL
jgi:hypothetical protein